MLANCFQIWLRLQVLGPGPGAVRGLRAALLPARAAGVPRELRALQQGSPAPSQPGWVAATEIEANMRSKGTSKIESFTG